MKTLSLTQNPLFLLWSVIKTGLSRVEKSEIHLPAKVNNYALDYEIKSVLNKPHKIGVYKGSDGNRILVKYWHGTEKNFAYYSLLNEAQSLKVLNRVTKNTHRTKIAVPSLIKLIVNDNELLIATEFIEGKLLKECSASDQYKIFSQSLEFLKDGSENLTRKEVSSLSQRTYRELLFIYPLILIVACLRQPRHIGLFLIGLPKVIESLYKLKNTRLSLVHRDLHTENIIVSKSKYYILDMQRLTLSYSLYELATTIAVEWNNKKLIKLILKNINNKESKILQGLLIHFATHGLTANNLPISYIDKYKDFLRYVVLKYNKNIKRGKNDE